MTERQIVSDIKLLLSRSTLSKDHRVSDLHLRYKVRQYRNSYIAEVYRIEGYIDPIWIQPLGNLEVTKVSSAEDENIRYSSECLGKLFIPPVVALPRNRGIQYVSSPTKIGNGMQQYFPLEPQRFFNLVKCTFKAKFKHYTMVQNSMYLTDIPNKVYVHGIWEDPLHGKIINNTYVANNALIVGKTYLVIDNPIVHNAITVMPGATFTAAATTFSGTGKVVLVNFLENATIDTTYPLTLSAAEYIITKILTIDFNLEQKQIADLKADSQDESNLTQTKQNRI